MNINNFSSKVLQSIKIRKATMLDRLGIQKVHKRSILKFCSSYYDKKVIDVWTDSKHFSQQKFEILLNNEDVIVAENPNTNEIIGFVQIKLDLNDKSGYIDRLYVDPDYVRCGVGLLLLHAAIKIGKDNELGIINLDSTLNALTFYLKCGFKQGSSKKWHFENTDVDLETISMSLEL